MIHVEHFNEHDNVEVSKILIDEFGMSPESIGDVLSKYDYDYIEGKVSLIRNSENFKYGKIRNLAAYLIDALRRDYKKSKSSSILMTESRDSLVEREKQINKIKEKQKNDYSKYVSDLIEHYFLSLDSEEKSCLLMEFERACDSYALTKYKKHGLDHAAVRAIFNMFIKNNKVSNQLRILNFDEFLYQEK